MEKEKIREYFFLLSFPPFIGELSPILGQRADCIIMEVFFLHDNDVEDWSTYFRVKHKYSILPTTSIVKVFFQHHVKITYSGIKNLRY